MARVVIRSSGVKTYYNDDHKIHREDGPAIIYPDGAYSYYLNGIGIDGHKHLLPDYDGDGSFMWYYGDRVCSKSIRPAIDYPSGLKSWYKNGNPIWPKL